MEFEKGLYVYLWQNPYENNCNTYLIRGEMTVLIDPGHAAHMDRLFHQMEADGVPADAVDLVIVTHCHPDHVEGLASFRDKSAKIAMSQEEERYLRGTGKRLFEMMRQPVPEFQIDFYLKEGDLHLGGDLFRIYQTPGHSPGSLSIYWPERKGLFTGDLVFYGGIGRTDFPGGNSKWLMESIERLSRLETEILLPGHGEVVKGREKVLENFESIRQNFYPYL